MESTARDAMFNDYYVVIATDAVASDEFCLRLLKLMQDGTRRIAFLRRDLSIRHAFTNK